MLFWIFQAAQQLVQR